MRKKPSSKTEAEAEPESKAEISPGQQSVKAEYSPEKKKEDKDQTSRERKNGRNIKETNFILQEYLHILLCRLLDVEMSSHGSEDPECLEDSLI